MIQVINQSPELWRTFWRVRGLECLLGLSSGSGVADTVGGAGEAARPAPATLGTVRWGSPGVCSTEGYTPLQRG